MTAFQSTVFASLFGLLSLTLAAWAGPAGPTSQDLAPVVQSDFEPLDCPAQVPADICGYISVPEKRSKPGRMIRLFVMIVKQTEKTPHSPPNPEPVFMLSGGPGEHAAPFIPASRWFPDRDFVVFDQRGNGYSQPALECPELFRGGDQGLDITSIGEQEYQHLFACGRRFKSRGIDLTAYNSTESAKDIETIRQTLGYDKINLIGVSYGTRLAQEYMRSYSDNLRSVILDSVVPASADRSAEMPGKAEAALLKVFAACEADANCREAYPDLTMRWLELVSHLDQSTGTPDEESQPLKVHHLLAHIFNTLYSPYFLSDLPLLVYRLHTGTMAPRTSLPPKDPIPLDEPHFISWGTFFSVECQGEIAFSRAQDLEQTFNQLPYWRQTMAPMPSISSPRIREVCQQWGLEQPSGLENDPVSSDVPTLLLAGHFDPVTPPEYMALAAQNLTQAYPFEFSGQAHSLLRNSLCARIMAQAFLGDPSHAPHSKCVNDDKIEF